MKVGAQCVTVDTASCYADSFEMRPLISIRGCVCPLVGPSVGPYVCNAFVKNARNGEFHEQK